MGRERRRCQHVGGAIVCGGTPSATDRAEVDNLRRYLAGEMSPAEVRAFTGLDGDEASDLGRTAAVLEITKGGGTPGQARVAAGLSLGQAAKLLGWSRERLVAVECCGTMSAEERGELAAVYDVAGFAPVKAADRSGEGTGDV